MIEVGVFDILLFILVTLVLLSGGSSILFNTSWGENLHKNRRMRQSNRIGLDKVSFLYREGYSYEIYNLPKPRFALNKLWFFSWYISRHLNNTIKKFNLELDSAAFARRFFTMNGDAYDVSGNGLRKESRLTMEQAAEFINAGFSDAAVYEMRRKGMSFDEMMELKGLPDQWVRRINA